MAIVINGSGTVTGLAVGGLPDGTVDAGTLASNAVTEAKIASSAVVTAKLNDDAVTNAKMANDAITEHELAGNAVVTAAINDDAITAAKLASGLIGNVTGGHFSRNIATVGTLALTGFGFTPKAIHFAYGNQYSGLNVGFGYQWGIGSHNTAISSPWTATGSWNIEPSNGYPITFFSGSGSNGNRTDGRVTSFDSDGVTITFSTPVGSPSGTMRVIYMAWG